MRQSCTRAVSVFFSSRRRHTRFDCDWSSDVCSSDLTIDGFSSSATTAFRDVDLWLKAEYVPTPRAGASYQILSSDWHRDGGVLTDAQIGRASCRERV